MAKELLTIGYQIPSFEKNEIDFQSNTSLMDSDILLISPESISPSSYGDWVQFSGGDGCYGIRASKAFKNKITQLKKETNDLLESGKTVFIILSENQSYHIANSVSIGKGGVQEYNTSYSSCYDFMPIDIGSVVSATGKKVIFSGNNIFANFNSQFKDFLEYRAYLENVEGGDVIFTGNHQKRTLGAIYKVGNGHLITLPMIKFDEDEFTETEEVDGEEHEIWNEQGVAFGNSLVQCLVEIAEKLTSLSEETPAPTWLSREDFSIQKEEKINALMQKNTEKIKKIQEKNEKLEQDRNEAAVLKSLLFEQGKSLENGVIRALEILGYQAENYNDGMLEMDQVIISPKGFRYIGESEGKDTKAINITKFRQLVDALNADFARDEVDKKAFGILFGNAERLLEPRKRKLDFTDKCKNGAEREGIALIKTSELFVVVRYLNEHNNEAFKVKCRKAIHDGLGKIVRFPKIPSSKAGGRKKQRRFTTLVTK